MMNHIKAVLIILFLLFVVIVAVQNYSALATPINFKVDLIFFNYESSNMPLSLVAVITFLIGVIAAALFGIRERFRMQKEIRVLKKEATQKDQELKSLRNLPVTTEEMRTESIYDDQ